MEIFEGEEVDKDEPDVPKITRNLADTRWSELFNDFLNQVYDVRNAPLAYVICANVEVAHPPPPLLINQPHTAKHGSVEGELVARLTHTSPVFRDENSAVYHNLEVATCSTIYASTLKPYQRAKDGRGAYFALMNQHVGQAKWEKKLKAQDNFIKTRIWKGNSNFSLEKFIEQHWAAFCRRAYITCTK